MRSVAFCTLGCKVNQYETDAMEALFADAGYEVRSFREMADIYIVNTCTVTAIADKKSRQMLHRARKQNPDALVIAVGCSVQTDPQRFAADTGIDLLVGNDQKACIVELVQGVLDAKNTIGCRSCLLDIGNVRTYENLQVTHTSEHTRAYIKIQDGCNQFCSYCIIPYVRGRVRSRRKDDILQEAHTLITRGYQELVLTGIHISSYGADFSEIADTGGGKKETLISLLESLAALPGLHRLRLGSLEPGIIDEDFVRRLREISCLCPHFHLSLQSGCDATLSRMNRRYTTHQYAHGCRLLRQYFADPAITTDVIVGFPQETDAEFARTLAFVQEIGFAQMHVFKYSKRQGTRAAQMNGQVPENVKAARSAQLLALSGRMRRDYIARLTGRQVEVLLEEETMIEGRHYMTGYTREYIRAAISGTGDQRNQRVCGVISQKFYEEMVICERID